MLVSLYMLVDDWWERAHPPSLSDAEVLALAILSQWPRFRSERDFFRFANAHLRPYFPNLISYGQLNRRIRALEPKLKARLPARPGRNTRQQIGGLPRTGHHPHTGGGPRESLPQASVRGTGRLRKMHLQDGVGLRLQGSPLGKPGGCHHGLRAGAGKLRRAAHRRVSPLFRRPRHLSCGQGLLLDELGALLAREEYGALVAATPQESARRAWPPEARRWAAGKRQLIEGVIDQLNDIFALERHRAKTLGGLLSRLAAKVTAYTCGQVLNRRIGRPIRHLASLLI
jgi:hypothetical protein